jgi:hypothetical protein
LRALASELGLMLQVFPLQKKITSAFLSAGSLPTCLSKAGKGRFTAVGMLPSLKRSGGRESKRKYFPFSGPSATRRWTSSVPTMSCAASLTGGFTEIRVAVFTPSFSVNSTRTSWPFLMALRAASGLSAFSSETTFSPALS